MSAGQGSGPIPGARDCQPHERQREDTSRFQAHLAQESAKTVMGVNRSQNQGQERSLDWSPAVKTCVTCCHYVGTDRNQCTVAKLVSPVDGKVYGGDPSVPANWQNCSEVRAAPAMLSSCGHWGHQWEPIF